MARGAGKNNWALFLLVLAGIVIGSFIAQATAGISALSWLNYGKNFGFTTPFVLDLGILVLTFGLMTKSLLTKRISKKAAGITRYTVMPAAFSIKNHTTIYYLCAL